MQDIPKKEIKNLDPKFSNPNFPKKLKGPGSKGWKNPLAEWVQRQAGKTTSTSGDVSNVNPIYGPIAGSAR